MSIANSLHQFINKANISYEIIDCQQDGTLLESARNCSIPLNHLARAVLLEDDQGLLLCILPANHIIDFEAIQAQLLRQPAPTDLDLAAKVFEDCEHGCVPPTASPYYVPVIIDAELSTVDQIYFEAGTHNTFVKMSTDSFQELNHEAIWCSFSYHSQQLQQEYQFTVIIPEQLRKDVQRLRPASSIRESISHLESLPSMPEMAHQLLRLRNNPKATIQELENIIATDPSLSAQIIRTATSPFYGYRGKITSIRDAIARVLGFETVLNMSLGIAATRSFKIPKDGPLGLDAFWRHALQCATISQTLANVTRERLNLKPGIAYLAGLIHNFGFLVLGHTCKAEFYLVNKIAETNPDLPILAIEEQVLGINHTETGANLLAHWEMPPELIITAKCHHDEYYQGEYAGYAHLVAIANFIVSRNGEGDFRAHHVPQTLLTATGLTREKVETIWEKLSENAETFTPARSAIA